MLLGIQMHTFFILYETWVKSGIASNGSAISASAREDIRKLYTKYINDSIKVEDAAKQVLLSKGLYIRPPHLPAPEEVKFVDNNKFLRGWLGDRRPLTITDLMLCISEKLSRCLF